MTREELRTTRRLAWTFLAIGVGGSLCFDGSGGAAFFQLVGFAFSVPALVLGIQINSKRLAVYGTFATLISLALFVFAFFVGAY